MCNPVNFFSEEDCSLRDEGRQQRRARRRKGRKTAEKRNEKFAK